MITLKEIKASFEKELAEAGSDLEMNMIKAEYNYRISKLENEGSDAYELAYIIPQKTIDEDCGCGKD
jgi:hypothetical protein